MSADYNAELAAEVAREWVAVQPEGRNTCWSCGNVFHVTREGKEPSIICPLCGFVPGLQALTDLRECIKKYKVKMDAEIPVAEEVPAEEVRGDPPGLDDVIGNGAAVLWIRTILDAFRSDLAKLDGRTSEAKALPFPHTLWSGPSGVGKSTLAQIIAREIKRPIHFQMGQSLTSPGRVGDVLLSLKAGDILFIDEIHGLKPVCQETLYRAMEDGVYIPIAKAGSPVVKPIHLPPFTLMGATTDIWGLLPPMLQRFKVCIRLKRLSAEELAEAMLRRADRAGLVLTRPAATMIGERSLGTPRLAIRLLDGCLATAKAQGKTEIDSNIVTIACGLLEIDRLGLDDDARKYLGFLQEANGDPVRVNVLASRLDGLSRLTLERRIEPDLIFLGLIDKAEKGRVLTPAGLEHLREAK